MNWINKYQISEIQYSALTMKWSPFILPKFNHNNNVNLIISFYNRKLVGKNICFYLFTINHNSCIKLTKLRSSCLEGQKMPRLDFFICGIAQCVVFI